MYSKVLFLFALAFGIAANAAGQTVAADATPKLPGGIETDTQRGYLVGPGDEITAKVLGEPQFDFIATVDSNGKIEVPFFDKPINAQCLSERDLRTEVTKLLSKYLKNPQISLRVTDRKSRPPATIYGEVRTPQQVVLTRRSTLLELLSFSGGVTDEAGGMIQVFRTQPPICSDGGTDADWKKDSGDMTDVPSRLYSLTAVKLGREEANPVIFPGDVVVVQKAAPVYITGEVRQPQGIYLKEGGVSLSEAIAKIGGVNREAKTKDIKIYRLKPNSKDREIIAANYDMIRKQQQKDIMLQPYDIVEVDKAKKSVMQTVMEIALGTGRAALGGFGNALPTRVLY
ncbi:MAG TPA: SLBB domain-containing protein [Pyrinomonadaceae bacterium]|nr:SLBB domain-containing protein [Pyrinomonadaceae bacterium]